MAKTKRKKTAEEREEAREDELNELLLEEETQALDIRDLLDEADEGEAEDIIALGQQLVDLGRNLFKVQKAIRKLDPDR